MGIRDEYGAFPSVPSGSGMDDMDSYGGELDQGAVQEREALLDVLEAEQEWTRKPMAYDGDGTRDLLYEEAVEVVSELDYSKETIRAYCNEYTWRDRYLSTLRNGLFLSALINEHDGEEYVLPDLSVEMGLGVRRGLSHVGYRNQKDITVQGSVGDHTGIQMEEGTIRIDGEAGTGLGAGMRGGTIRVGGTVEGNVGEERTGGVIEVQGVRT